MAARVSGSGLWVILGIIGLVLLIPREIWIALGIAVALGAGIYFYIKWKSIPTSSAASFEPEDTSPTLAELTVRHTKPGREAAGSGPSLSQVSSRSSVTIPPPVPPPALPAAPAGRSMFSRPPLPAAETRPSQGSVTPQREQAFFEAALQGQVADTPVSYAMPEPPAGAGEGRWLSPGESIEVAGTMLTGGMIYVGTRLKGLNNRTDPCLITPLASVARFGSYTQRQTDYWPSYSDISAAARRAYLDWLAQGRSDPECDIGYVFLFFYGLERRVIVEGDRDPATKQDWPTIADELRRLIGIYGKKSGSFQRYASGLLNWIELEGAGDKLYLKPVPTQIRAYELPMYLRLALGQAAQDRAPITPKLALAWVLTDPQVSLRTPATRCAEEFGKLFMSRYTDAIGNGLVLPKNRTKLKFVYQPASSGFHGVPTPTRNFGEVPDITALTAPIRRLQDVVDQCTDELAPFSRLLGKDPDARNQLEGLLQLPLELWPDATWTRLQSLADKVHEAPLTLQLSELLGVLGGNAEGFNKDKVRGLAKTLVTVKVGMEPNVLDGAKTPAADDPVVLFALQHDEVNDASSAAYRASVLTLQLASAVAQADGSFSSSEEEHLGKEVDQWSHLTDAHRVRLKAHLRWLTAAPATLAGLKKKLEPLEASAREAIATFMATLAQADGVVSPAEVKFLEKVYKALGVEPKRVFSDVHAVSAGAPAPARTEKVGFRLDASRIAALQQDTEKVTALLAGIFKEEEPPPAPVPVEEPEAVPATGLLGLDESHSALARLLLSRPQWARSELEDAATDLELMLDGALEQINEASFEAFDLPLTEGDDPVEVTAEVVEKIEA